MADSTPLDRAKKLLKNTEAREILKPTTPPELLGNNKKPKLGELTPLLQWTPSKPSSEPSLYPAGIFPGRPPTPEEMAHMYEVDKDLNYALSRSELKQAPKNPVSYVAHLIRHELGQEQRHPSEYFAPFQDPINTMGLSTLAFMINGYMLGGAGTNISTLPKISNWIKLHPRISTAIKNFAVGVAGEGMIDATNPYDMIISGGLFAGGGALFEKFNQMMRESGLKAIIKARLLANSEKPLSQLNSQGRKLLQDYFKMITNKAQKTGLKSKHVGALLDIKKEELLKQYGVKGAGFESLTQIQARLGIKPPRIKIVNKMKELTQNPMHKAGLRFAKALDDFNGAVNVAQYDALQAKQEWDTLLPKDKVVRAEFLHQLELGDKFSGDPTGKVPKHTWNLLKAKYRISDNAIYNETVKSGIDIAYRDNHIYHITRAKPEKVTSYLYPKGGFPYGTTPGFAKKRRFLGTLKDLRDAGLDPVDDPALIQAAQRLSLGRAKANKALIDTLRNIKTEDGANIIMAANKAPTNYKFVNNSTFTHYMYHGQTKTGIPFISKVPDKVHPKFVKDIEALTTPWTSMNPYMKAYVKVRGDVKRMIMYNPAIHGVNIFSDVFDEASFSPFKSIKIFATGKKIWSEHPNIVKRALADNLNLTDVSNIAGEITKEIRLAETNAPKSLLGIIRSVNDKLLWGSIVRNAQLGIYMLKRHQLVEQYGKEFTNKELGRLSAHFTNDLLGTLPRQVFTPRQDQYTKVLFFARNWTISNLRLITGAMGIGGDGKLLPQFLRHQGLSERQLQVLSKEYSKHLLKGTAGLFLQQQILQNIFQGLNGQELTSIFNNEKGKKIGYIDTGLRRPDGRKIYFKAFLFKYMGDYFGWGGDPAGTFYNKMEPILRTALEQIFNIERWSGKQIVNPQAPFLDQMMQRLEHAAKALTPVEAIMGREGQVRSIIDFLVMASGGWIAHGTKGGELGKDIIEFRLNKGYNDERSMLKVRELLLQGKDEEAIELSVKNNRYSSKQGIKNLYLQFAMPLAHKYKSIAKKDQKALEEWLKARHGKHALELLKIELKKEQDRAHKAWEHFDENNPEEFFNEETKQ